MSESISEPIIRLRVKHDRTLKDGWRCSETTVEIEGREQDLLDTRPRLAFWLKMSHDDGLQEANRRNVIERE